MNEVTVTWAASENAEDAEVTNYYVQVLPEDRIVKVDADTLTAVVSGLKNGMPVEVIVHAASERGRSKPSERVAVTPTSGMEGEVAGLIVKFEPGTAVTDGSTDVPGAELVDEVALTADRELIEDTRLVELSEPVSLDAAKQIATELTADPQVQWAEPDQFVFVSSTQAPDDPQYATEQWNLWDEYGIGLGDGATRTTSAYDLNAGAGTTVAVIDTGITAHPDLDGQLVTGYDFVSDPDALAAPREEGGAPVRFDADGQSGWDADPTDPGDWRGVAPARNSTWHGTHIAGIIAAKANNAEGIAGIAPGAKVQPIRALSWRGGLISDIAAAITWASGGTVDGVANIAKPADVINMSFTVNATCSVTLQTAINDANERGSVLVAAAGNANDDVANYAPANCSNVISVGATGRDGKRAPYSNWGAGVDISAPGGSLSSDGGVLSTSNSGVRHGDAPDYRAHEGTSVAAAHVSAAIAWMKAQEPALTPAALAARVIGREQVRAFPADQCDTEPAKTCGGGVLRFGQVAAQSISINCLDGIGGARTVSVSVPPLETLTITHQSCFDARVEANVAPVATVTHNGSPLTTNRSLDSGVPVSYQAPAEAKLSVDKLRFRSSFVFNQPYNGSPWTGQPTVYLEIKVELPATPVDVTLDANGGEVAYGGGTPAASTMFNTMSGTSITLPTPTRDGYAFIGWWTSSTGGVRRSNPYKPSATETLYARWGWTLSLNANGGSVSPSAKDVAEGQPASLPVPTRAGHRFVGWFTQASGGSQRVDGYMPSASETLYARWVERYTITFDANGMTNGPSPILVDAGAPVTVADLPSGTPSSNFGIWTFLGWFDGDTPVFPYSAQSGYSLHANFAASGGWVPGSSATLTAHWTRNVYVYGPGSQGQVCSGTSLTYTATMTASSRTPTITLGIPSGVPAEFVSWFASRQPMNADPTLEQDPRWTSGDSRKPVRVTGAGGELLGLRVVVDQLLPESICTSWTATTTFDPGVGSVGTTSQSGPLGNSRVAPLPWNPGYAFTGWFDPDAVQRVSPSDLRYTMAKTQTLDAGWQQFANAPQLQAASLSQDRKTVVLTFSKNVLNDAVQQATMCDQFRLTSTHTAFPASRVCSVNGATVTITSTAALSASVATLEVAYVGSALRDAADATLRVAQTANLRVFGVGHEYSFAGNGGTAAQASIRVPAGSPLTMPSATRTGLRFLGWYDQAARGNRVGGEGSTVTPTGDKLLYAQWEARITYNAVGSTAPPAGDLVNVSDDPVITLPSPTRAGHTFVGWFTAATGGARVGEGGDAYSVASDVTLHARWQANVVPAPPSDPVPNPTTSDAPAAKPLDVPPPRVEVVAPEVVPARERPAVMVVDGRVEVLRVERNEVQVGLDVLGDDFTIALATADVAGNRIAPAANASLVAPVLGHVQVQARGYVPDSMVSLYLIPRSSLQLRPRSKVSSYYLGEGRVRADQTLVDDFRLPDWAGAGEYVLQINGYTDTGSVRSINVQLDLIDVREMTTVAARVCVFPGSQVRLAAQCRQSLRSLVQLMPDEPTRVVLAITGVAYAQGDAERNERVAERRAKGIRQFLAKVGVSGKTTIDVVIEKGRVPGFFVDPPPPVAVSAKGKPASTVLLTVTWTQDGSGWAAS